MPEMARTIHHTNIKGKRGRKPKSKLTEPDFYNPDAKLPASEAEDPQAAPGDEWGGEGHGKKKSSPGSPSSLRQDQQPKMAAAYAARAPEHAQKPASHLDFQGATGPSISLRGDPTFAESLAPLAARSSQSLRSPAIQHDISGSSSQAFHSRLSGYLQQQQQRRPSGLRNPQHFAAGESDEHVPVPVLARQNSDYSLGGGLGLFGLAEAQAPSDDVATFASLEAFSAAQANQAQPGMPVYQDHQQRINDLIYRNQQQQRNLQLQQQQLEQQRLELQLRQQQQQDLTGRQAMPLASANFLLRDQQQQLQQYQNQLSNQASLSLGLPSRQQQDHGQGQGLGDPQHPHYPYQNPPPF